MSLIDDKKSSQITYNTDQVMNDRETQRAFFEQAERQIAQPPEFEPWKLDDDALSPDLLVWSQPDTGYVQAPEFAQPPRTHEDDLKETILHFSDQQCLQNLGSTSLVIVASLRRLN